MYTSLVLYSTIFALSMERTRLTFHCWLYNLCIVVYVKIKLETWNLFLNAWSKDDMLLASGNYREQLDKNDICPE